MKGETSQAPKPAPYRPGLDRPTLINSSGGSGATARDDEAGRERILANLEGRSPRTGTTARGRKRMAMWSFGLVGVGVAVAASYWYVVSSSLPTVQTAAVQNAEATKPVRVAAGSEAPAMASGAVTVAANAPTAAGAMAAPTAVIENMSPPASNAPAAAAATPVQAMPEPKAEPKKAATVAAAKPNAVHAKSAAVGGKAGNKTVAANSGDRKSAKKTGQADNDVDLIEALIVHTMQSGSDGKGASK